MSYAARAGEITGAVQNTATLDRIDKARALGLPILCDSRPLPHPQFENARVPTPLLLTTDAQNPDILPEWLGPVLFVVATDSNPHSIDLPRRSVQARSADRCVGKGGGRPGSVRRGPAQYKI